MRFTVPRADYNFAQFDYMQQRLDRWHGEGTSNTSLLLNSGHSINFENSEYYVEDGSFFRIRNVQLGYTFDKALLCQNRFAGTESLCQHSEPENLEAQHRLHPLGGAPPSECAAAPRTCCLHFPSLL